MNSKLLTPFCSPAKKSNPQSYGLKKALLALFCMAGFGLHAQVSSYTPTGTGVGQTYTPIAATAVFGSTAAATLDNAVSGAVPIGFNFNFNGKVYTTCYISFNGFITFGSAPTGTEFTPLSSTATYEAAIAGYAKDLKGAGVDVYRQTQGAVGSRTFTVQWTAYRSTLANTPINMQVILYETTNVVEVKYNISATSGTQTIAQTGQVGLRGDNNTDFNNKNHTVTGAWPTAAPVLARGTVNTNTVTTRFAAACITAPTTLTWTPPTCFAPRRVTATPVLITYNSATITWLAANPAPANGYQYLVSTTPPNNINVTYPVAGTAATGTVGAGVLTTPVSPLSSNTLYYIYVRSDCGGLSGWSAAGSFTTLCTPYSPLPYTQDFESGYTVPAIPPCNKVEDLTGEVAPYGRWLTNTAIPSPGPYGFLTKHAQCTTGGSIDNNTTYFIEGIQLTAGTSYRLSYKYGASNEFATTEQSMSVSMYSAPYFAATSIPLADHPDFKGGPYTNVINFTPAATAVYYIGFNDYSLAGNATLLLDDIDLRESTCIPPTALNAGALTGTSATINWTAPVLVPGSGYNYYVSTSSTPPNSGTTPTGSVGAGITVTNLSGLTPATTYYFWIRSNCGSGDYSGWSVMGTFTTASVPSVTYCLPSGATFNQDANGITNVTMGSINNNTGIEPNNYGDYSAMSTTVYQGAVVPVQITYRTGFTYETKIWVDWNNDGDFVDAGEEVASGVSGGANPTTLTLNFTVPGAAILGQHRLRIGGIDDGVTFPPPLTPCRVGQYMAFEDYSIFVTTAPPALTLSATPPPICNGDSVPVSITSVLSNYNVYSWSPNGGITGTAPNYTFTPTSTNTYTLTGFNTTTFQTTTTTITITVNQPPTPITITPASATVCQGQVAQQLTATGGIVSGVSIYSENFNGTAPGWTTTNATTGSTPAAADWVLAPDGYTPFLFLPALHSNDMTQFAFTESDGPGIGSTTATTLTSPPINLTGYTTASLSFWQFYRWFNGPESGTVQISNNISGPWTNLQSYGSTGNVGTDSTWNNAIIDLTPYTTYATAYIRFKYDAVWDWGWAIDNFVISGSATTSVTWAPAAGLYTTAAATPGTEYVAGTGALTVYALPSSTQTYTASAQSGLGCTTSTNVTITVTPISGGTMPVTSQTVCGGGAAADIVITPATVTGTILYWQYANDAAFTSGVTNIAGSGGLTTLTSALIGTLTATRYYRAVISVGGCANAYSQVHTITVPSTTYDGFAWSNGLPNINTQVIFTGNYTMTANMSACSVVVQSGTVTVNSGVTFTVQNAVSVNAAANLIFQDDASLVQVNSAVPNSGDIIYRRITTPMRLFDYTYWSSPVDGQIISKVSPNTLYDKYFWFNTATYQWTAVTAPGSTLMTVGRGYIIRAPQTFTTTPAPFSTFFGYDGVSHGGGVPNNGNYTVPVGRFSATQDLDCIGNPYPSAISANLFISDPANTAALGAGTTLYFWTHNTPITAMQYTQDDYASWNYSGGVGTGSPAASAGCPGCNNLAPNGNIAAGQSFMVKVAASGNVTFKNSMRVAGNNDRFFRMANSTTTNTDEGLERHRVWLEMKNSQGAYKQMLVGYIENATNGIDAGYDGELVEAGNVIALYSILDNAKLTIQGRALPFNATEEIPLGYRSNIAGSFEIAIADLDGLFTTQGVYLEDKLLNVVHNLKQGAYSFATESGTFNTRFVLRYSNSTLAVTTPVFDENAVVVYKDKQTIHVETSNVTMKSVKVYDLRGREIFVKDNVNSNKTEISNLLVAQEVLLVQVTSTDNVTVINKIVY